MTVGQRRDPRRLGLGAVAIIAGYALVVAAIAAGVIGGQGPEEFAPPQSVPRPLLLGALFMLPAAVAAIGAVRCSRPILLAAGALCLGQSFIAFSGVTIPFVVPAFLLLVLGGRGWETETAPRTVVGGVLVVLLGIAMWVAPVALSDTTCWIARRGADGTVNYTRTPVSNESALGPGDLAAGCDGGQFTIQGMGLAAVFWIGAVAVTVLASATPLGTRAAAEGVV